MPEATVKTKTPKTNRIKLENVRAKNRKVEESELIERIHSFGDDVEGLTEDDFKRHENLMNAIQ